MRRFSDIIKNNCKDDIENIKDKLYKKKISKKKLSMNDLQL